MTGKEDVNEIVQSFVDNDLSSLDRIGGESDTFTLSPHLAQPSPDLNAKQDTKFDAAGRTQAPQAGAASSTTQQQAGMGPDLKPGEGGPSSHPTSLQAPGAQKPQGPRSQAPSSQGPSSHTGSARPDSETGPDAKPGLESRLESKVGPEPRAESKAVPVAPVGPGTQGSLSPDLSASETGSRHVSTSSTASGSTLDQEKRASLGDRFKKFGKRITSGSRK